MIKQERHSRSNTLKIVHRNVKKLKEGPQTLKAIVDVLFDEPNKLFLTVMNTYGYDEFTYGDIYQLSLRYGHYFRSNLNPEEKYVALHLDNSKDWVAVFFGLILAGFVPVLLSTANSLSEIPFLQETIPLHVAVSESPVEEYFDTVIHPLSLSLNDEAEDDFSACSDMVVFLTSGTSGHSKVVFYNGEQLCQQMYIGGTIREGSHMLCRGAKGYLKHLVVLPFYHVFGGLAVLLWFAIFHDSFVLPKDLSPKSLRQSCLLTHPSHIFAVPLFWETIAGQVYTGCDTPKKKKKLSSALKMSEFLQNHLGYFGTVIVREILFRKVLGQIFGTSIRFCITGGAMISSDTIRLVNLLGYPLVNGYGSTEFGIASMVDTDTLKDRLTTSIGRPFQTVEMKIQNQELVVKSPSSCLFVLEGKEKIVCQGKSLHSHDMAEEKDGKIFLLGRSDEVIVSENGENLSLPLLEERLSLPYPMDFAFCYAERIHLILCQNSHLNQEEWNRNVTVAEAFMKEHHLGKIYVTRTPFAKANGLKIKRKELTMNFVSHPELFVSVDHEKDTFALFASEEEKVTLIKIKAVFGRVLPDAKVEDDSEFYKDLGGDSLHLYVLLDELDKEFKTDLTIASLLSKDVTPKNVYELLKGKSL